MGYQIVVIGTSLGGLHALSTLLGALPAGLALPLAIVQHRASGSSGLAEFLQRGSALPVVEVEDKQTIAAGRAYLAPPDYHTLVSGARFALSTDAPVRHARPSIDVLFDSAAVAYGPAAVGVILTGASDDGAAGLARIRRSGGLGLVQDPSDAACPVMPRAALARGADRVLTLAALAPALCELASASPSPMQRCEGRS